LAKRGRKRRPAKSDSSPVDVLKLIPGYDPWVSAGDCVFDQDAADRAVDFFAECLHHVKGKLAGQPFRLHPWEESIVQNIFGWKRPDGTRRYREAFIMVGRKNGKTTLAAGLVLYVLLCDNEPGAEVYSAAADREQAALIYDQAKGMIYQEPALQSRCKTYETSKTIVVESTMSRYKAISREAGTKYGLNVHCAVIDELHAQPDRELVDVLMTATGARRQPLIVHITTSDYDRESICNEKYDYGCKVRDGVIDDPAFLPVIYEASRDDDWTSPETWRKANPNLGVSISEEYLRQECQRAQEIPAYENTFKRLHLNIRTEQAQRWLAIESWDACCEKFLVDELIGEPCWAGLDLSSSQDLTALSLIFKRDGSYLVLPFFWVPGENARRREKRDKVPYITWAKQGYITLTPGDVMDYDWVRNSINQLKSRYRVQQIAVDRWAAADLIAKLQADGFDVVPFGQGFASMSAPSKEFERLIIGKRLIHNGHPVLRWNVSNVAADTDAAGNIKPNKARSADRIDGVVATIMALALAMQDQKVDSVYKKRGVLWV